MFNGDYKFSKSTRHLYDISTGRLNFTESLVFKNKHPTGRRYINHFATRFAHTGLVYDGDSVRNIETGLYRLFNCRIPKVNGQDETDPKKIWDYEQELRNNMRCVLGERGDRWANDIRQQIGIMSWNTDREAALEEVITLPHPKLEMRKHAYEQAMDSGKITRVDLGSKIVDCKTKYPEFGKPNKNIRFIIDCRVGRSIIASTYFDALKHHLGDREIFVKGCLFIFITGPKTETIIKYLLMLRAKSYRKILIVFSDDACYCDCDGYGNADISSCDVTHITEHFDFSHKIFQFPDYVLKHLTEQQLGMHQVVNPHNRKERLFFKPKTRKQQSGSTYTTLWNVILWLMVFMLWVEEDITLEEAARRCGVLVTLEVAKQFEDLQFLKHSPTQDTRGDWHAVMNPGVLFRMSGSSKTDIPRYFGKKKLETWEERCRVAQTMIVNGYLQYFSCPEFEKLRLCKTDKVMTTDWKIQQLEAVKHEYTLELLMKRYNPSTHEVDELRSLLNNSEWNSVIYSTLVNKVLKKDYGIECPIL